MGVVWNKEDFLIDLCDENIEDSNSTWDNSEPMEDGRYMVSADYGLSSTGIEKFCQSVFNGDIECPELKEYFEDLDAGDLEKWENGEIEETRRGYIIYEERLDWYKNEAEWKEFIRSILENGDGIGYCRIHFLVGVNGQFEIVNIVRIETTDDANFQRYTVPQQFLDALLEAWLEKAGSKKTLVNYLKRGLPENVRLEMNDDDDDDDEDAEEEESEESVDMLSFIGQFISPSRYRGLACEDRYTLKDDRFAYVVDDVLICTDDECDIECDGNICMVWSDGKVLHIGRVPEPEDSITNKVRYSRRENTLVMSYRVWYDNDHHHGGMEEVTVDLTPTPERRKRVVEDYLAEDIRSAYRGVDSRFWVDQFKVSFVRDREGNASRLKLTSRWNRRYPRQYKTYSIWESLYVNLHTGKFEDNDGNLITGQRFFMGLRCIDETIKKDARADFCDRWIPLVQELYPATYATDVESTPPLAKRAMVLREFMSLLEDKSLADFKDYLWVERFSLRYQNSYNKIAYELSDDKIAEIFRYLK